MKTAALRLALALAALAPLGARAATINVPADFATIQEAINAAVDGDEILVAPGTYTGALVVARKTLNFRSTGGKDVTILDGAGQGSVFTLVGTQQSSYTSHYYVTLDGFTFTNGASGWIGGGISAQYHCELTVRNSLITGNTAPSGGGIAAFLDAWVTAENVTITNNTASYAGGGTYGYVGAVSVLNGVVTNNTAGSYGGGGAGLYYCGAARFDGTVVAGNSAQIGGGLFAAFDSACNSSFALHNAIVTKNVASVRGGAAALMGGTAVSAYVTQSTITENVAPEGGGWWNEAQTYMDVQSSIIWNNSTPSVFSPRASTYLSTLAYNVLEGDPSESAGFNGDGTNVFGDPLFVDPANGDYHLQAASPAIDLVPGPSGVDFDGMARVGRGNDAGAFEYDNVAPTTSLQLAGTPGQLGWYTSAVDAALTAVDQGKGVKELAFTLDGAETTVQGDAAALSVTTDGQHVLAFHATDRNGNVEAAQTASFGIDATPPALSLNAAGTAGKNGWYQSASATATAADATSGLAQLFTAVDGEASVLAAGASATVALAEGTHQVTAGAIDVAGNTASAALAVNVDGTAPVAAAALAGTAGTNGWYRSAVTVTVTATDATSGVASVGYGTNGTLATTVPGAIATATYGDGSRTVTYGATDVAGNASALGRVSFKADARAPSVSLSVSPTTVKANGQRYAIKVSGGASDATSGVASTTIKVTNASGATLGTTSFGSSFTVTGTKGQKYTFTATTTDKAGNATVKTAVVTVQ